MLGLPEFASLVIHGAGDLAIQRGAVTSTCQRIVPYRLRIGLVLRMHIFKISNQGLIDGKINSMINNYVDNLVDEYQLHIAHFVRELVSLREKHDAPFEWFSLNLLIVLLRTVLLTSLQIISSIHINLPTPSIILLSLLFLLFTTTSSSI